MNIVTSVYKRSIKLCFIVFANLGMMTAASAALITPDLTASVTTNFDSASSFGATSGDFSVISAGSTTTNTYSDFTAITSDTLSDGILNTGDGTTFTGSALLTDADDGYLIGFDSLISLANNSLTDIIEIVFRLDLSNSILASGDDGFTDSEFFILDNGADLHVSDIMLDTVNGNETNGELDDPEAYGGAKLDTFNDIFTFTLNPGDIIDIELFWTLEGYAGLSSTSQATFSQSFIVESSRIVNSNNPQPVPEPTTLALLLIAMFLFTYRKKLS